MALEKFFVGPRRVDLAHGFLRHICRPDGDHPTGVVNSVYFDSPGLDEYDSHAVVHAIHPEPLGKPLTTDDVKQHFRLLREGLLAWMAGRTQPQGMPSWAEFSAGVQGALDHVRAHHAGQKVLIVSSGGPISTAVAQVLGAPAEAAVAMNMRLRNSALTEFVVTPKRHELVAFNHLPHLDDPDRAGWITHA